MMLSNVINYIFFEGISWASFCSESLSFQRFNGLHYHYLFSMELNSLTGFNQLNWFKHLGIFSITQKFTRFSFILQQKLIFIWSWSFKYKIKLQSKIFKGEKINLISNLSYILFMLNLPKSLKKGRTKILLKNSKFCQIWIKSFLKIPTQQQIKIHNCHFHEILWDQMRFSRNRRK